MDLKPGQTWLRLHFRNSAETMSDMLLLMLTDIQMHCQIKKNVLPQLELKLGVPVSPDKEKFHN